MSNCDFLGEIEEEDLQKKSKADTNVNGKKFPLTSQLYSQNEIRANDFYNARDKFHIKK